MSWKFVIMQRELNQKTKVFKDEHGKHAQELLKEKAQKYGTQFQPGVLTLVPEVLVDGNEKGFTKILYQDENDKKIEVPIQAITPESYPPAQTAITELVAISKAKECLL